MADVTSTQQEIEAQRRQALEDMAQLGYRTQEGQATQQAEYNRQAAANAAFTQQMASNINAPQELQAAMQAQSQHAAGQGSAALNNSQARDQQYRSATQTENELYFDRALALVPLYQQAAAAAAAARGGGGGGGSGGGGGGSTNAGGFFDQGMSADEIQKAGYALADQERSRRKGAALSRHRRGRIRLQQNTKLLQSQREREQKARRIQAQRTVNRNVNSADEQGRGTAIKRTNLIAQQLQNLPFGFGRRAGERVSALGPSIGRGELALGGTGGPNYTDEGLANEVTRARQVGAEVRGRMPGAVQEALASTADAAQYNDRIEADWPFSNDRIALALEQMQAQQFPVDPFAAQAAFAENFSRPMPEQQPQQLGYVEALRSTPEYQQGRIDVFALSQQGYSEQAAGEVLRQAGYPPDVLRQILNDNYLPYDSEYEQEFAE